MDKSKEYVDMCNKAEMLQTDKTLCAGDYFKIRGSDSVSLYNCGDNRIRRNDWISGSDVWLPRVDQLIDLIQNWNKEHSTAFFDYMRATSWHPKEQGWGSEMRFDSDSIEKHLLKVYMHEQHQMKWDKENKNWIKNTNS